MDIGILTGIDPPGKASVWTDLGDGNCSAVMQTLPLHTMIHQRIYANRSTAFAVPVGVGSLTASNASRFMSQLPFANSKGGMTVVHGEDKLDLQQPLYHQYTLPRVDGSRAAYERAKRSGGIYIMPDERYTISVPDIPVVLDHSGSIPSAHHAWFTEMAPAPSRYACRRQLYDAGGVDVDQTITLGRVNTFVPRTQYTVFKDAKVVSGLKLHGDEVRSFVDAVVRTIRNHDFSTGLVTAGTAELNSAYWDIATELGELPETVKMIYNGLKAIITKYLEARRKIASLPKNNISSGSALTDVASIWMAYRYGIMPIVYSINDALDYLHSQGVFRTVRQGENFEIPLQHSGNQYMITGRDRYWGKARVDPLDAKTGLKMNIMSTAWELVPLSFVIDWAFNIGDLLSSLQGPSGAKEIKHSYSRRVEFQALYEVNGNPFNVNISYYMRQPINPMSHIGLTLDLQMTWKRVLDALSLSWFAFKSQNRGNIR